MGETENKLSDFGKICGVSQSSVLGPRLFLIYVNNMPQAIKSNLLLYTVDSCLMYQHKELKKKRNYKLSVTVLRLICENICEWFLVNKLNIHFVDDETKSILS